jgi:hypothetical protein
MQSTGRGVHTKEAINSRTETAICIGPSKEYRHLLLLYRYSGQQKFCTLPPKNTFFQMLISGAPDKPSKFC